MDQATFMRTAQVPPAAAPAYGSPLTHPPPSYIYPPPSTAVRPGCPPQPQCSPSLTSCRRCCSTLTLATVEVTATSTATATGMTTMQGLYNSSREGFPICKEAHIVCPRTSEHPRPPTTHPTDPDRVNRLRGLYSTKRIGSHGPFGVAVPTPVPRSRVWPSSATPVTGGYGSK
jgi:hypothetical protein